MIKKGFLSKKGGQWRSYKLYDIAIMLYNAHKAPHTQLGWVDANNSLDTIKRRLNQRLLSDPAIIESLIAICNMLDEIGQFEHPEEATFDAWAASLHFNLKFDKKYNIATYEKVAKGEEDA